MGKKTKKFVPKHGTERELKDVIDLTKQYKKHLEGLTPVPTEEVDEVADAIAMLQYLKSFFKKEKDNV